MDAHIKEVLREVSSASVASALLKFGLRNVWIRGARPLASATGRCVGEAFTLRFVPMREDLVGPALADLPTSREAIEIADEGAVMVIDAMGVLDAGVAGDVLCGRMVRRGIGGLITDGAIRDLAGVEQSGLPVWAGGVSSPAPGNSLTFVDYGLPIACGGVTIFPKDIIVADRDGAVVVPAKLLEQVAREAAEIERFDAWVVRKVDAGEKLPGLYPPGPEMLALYKAESS